jgi:hypothetical protein
MIARCRSRKTAATDSVHGKNATVLHKSVRLMYAIFYFILPSIRYMRFQIPMRRKPDTDYPKIAVATLIQRASDIVAACDRDRNELCEAGLDWKNVEKLAGLIVPCADIDAEYRYQKQTDREKTALARDRVVQCCKLRNTTVNAVRAAFTLAGIEATVPVFPRKQAGAGVVQDLSDIAMYCHLNAEKLKKTHFDFHMAEEAENAAKELSEALAENGYNKTNPSELLEKRNRLCKELYEAMVEICGLGRNVFRKDVLRKKAYRVY